MWHPFSVPPSAWLMVTMRISVSSFTFPVDIYVTAMAKIFMGMYERTWKDSRGPAGHCAVRPRVALPSARCSAIMERLKHLLDAIKLITVCDCCI